MSLSVARFAPGLGLAAGFVAAGRALPFGRIDCSVTVAPGATVTQPDFWPAYSVPAAVPVTGTSAAVAPELVIRTTPSWSEADTVPARRVAAQASCWTSVAAICRWLSCSSGAFARS